MLNLRRTFLASLTFLALYLGSAAVGRADTIAFTFTINGTIVNLPMATFQANGSGPVSPFGTAAFQANGSLGAVNLDGSRPVSGTFTFGFSGGNSFIGSFTGLNLARDPVTHVALFTRSLTITGGTGIFSLATGSATAAGSSLLDPTTGIVTFSFSSTDGSIRVVPEPTTMLLLGTGLVGLASRVRKRKSSFQR